MTVVDFCTMLKISTSTYYRVRSRVDELGITGIHHDSTAPHNPRRRYGDDIRDLIVDAHLELKNDGWDAGAISIHDHLIRHHHLAATPSVSTIHRILSARGLTSVNARKRPRASYRRFARDKAMELWQLDGFTHYLADDAATKVTVYQLIDDATRLDLGSHAVIGAESTAGAVSTLTAAIDAYGAPVAVLTDNGPAFAMYRWGRVSATERFLAGVGTRSITGRPAHPRTQGKTERSHRTLRLYLAAHPATTIDALNATIADYRDRYNNQRSHQAFRTTRGRLSPNEAWEVAGQADSPPAPIPPDELYRRALAYRTTTATAAPVADVVVDARTGGEVFDDDDLVFDAGLEAADDGGAGDIVTVNGRGIIGIGPVKLYVGAPWVGRKLIRLPEPRQLTFFCAIEGHAVCSVPQPLPVSLRGRVNISSIPGAWHRDPPRINGKRTR